MTPATPRRAIASWCLYDFANSIYAAVISSTVWPAYYAGAIVGDAGVGAMWWGRAVSLSMIAVAITSPFMGAVADATGRRKILLFLYTLTAVVATALLGTVEQGMIIYGFALSVLAGFGFEGAMVFYNSYLPELAPAGRQGRISGLGFAVGYAGSLLGLMAVLPLVRAEHYTAVFLAVAILFFLFSLPAFLWLPRDRSTTKSIWQAGREGWRNTRKTARDIARTPVLRRFLIAYFIYADGVSTIIVFSAIFARETLGFAMSDLILLFMSVQVSALVGAALWAKPTDRIGPKTVVLVTIVQWIAVVIAIHFVETRTMFYVVAVFAGLGLGAIQSASRTFMATLTPNGREGEFFGFYSLCGKASAVLGPLVFGQVAVMTGGNLRLAVLSILVFFVAGGIVLLGVRGGGPTAAAEN